MQGAGVRVPPFLWGVGRVLGPRKARMAFDRESVKVCALRSRSRRFVHLGRLLDLRVAGGFVHAASLSAASQPRFVEIHFWCVQINFHEFFVNSITRSRQISVKVESSQTSFTSLLRGVCISLHALTHPSLLDITPLVRWWCVGWCVGADQPLRALVRAHNASSQKVHDHECPQPPFRERKLRPPRP